MARVAAEPMARMADDEAMNEHLKGVSKLSFIFFFTISLILICFSKLFFIKITAHLKNVGGF